MSRRIRISVLVKSAVSAGAVALIFWLLGHVVHYGYRYQFDTDELYHLQAAYEIARGRLPYVSYLFPYSPVLHWLLQPTFGVAAPGEATMFLSRGFMGGLFVLRTFTVWAIGMTVFGWWGSLLLAALFLADPFTSFAGMQIRPDNIAVLLQTMAVFFFLEAVRRRHRRSLILLGMTAAGACLASLKVVPSMAVLVASAIWLIRSRRERFVLGISVALPVMLFGAYWIAAGAFVPMLRGILVDAKAINDSLQYPLPIVNFYWPSNWFLYGSPRQSLLWYFELSLPITGFCGALTAIRHRPYPALSGALAAIAVASLVQWAALIAVRSVFLQYYLPVNWLLVLFTAVFWIDLIRWTGLGSRAGAAAARMVLAAAMVAVIRSAVTINMSRSQYDATVQLRLLHSLWAAVPPGAAVFPGLLYRPGGSYLGYGWNYGDIPLSIRRRIPMINEAAADTVSYVYLPGNQLNTYDSGTAGVITASYARSASVPDVWQRRTLPVR
jgi:hypothetical protein